MESLLNWITFAQAWFEYCEYSSTYQVECADSSRNIFKESLQSSSVMSSRVTSQINKFYIPSLINTKKNTSDAIPHKYSFRQTLKPFNNLL